MAATFPNDDELLRFAERARDAGDLAGAAGLYQRAALRGSAQAYAELGFILRGMGDSDYAETAFQRAAEGGHGLGWYGLGLLRTDAGDPDQADALYRRAAETGQASLIRSGGGNRDRERERAPDDRSAGRGQLADRGGAAAVP